MKSRLITRYHELREQRQLAVILERNWEAFGLLIEMGRIDQILYKRYSYDVSLIRKFN
jgi:hypothetical protein